MSNCITPHPDMSHGIELDPSMFEGLKEVRDTDGNRITREGPRFMLYMAPMTTWREWRHFLWDHVQPYVTCDNVRIPTVIYDECDGFDKSFTVTARLQPPGTMRPTKLGDDAYKQWQAIYV